MIMDVDRFKEVNDTFGHAAGDAVLRQVAATLQGCVRQSDTVARLGGDEFVVVLEDIKEWANANSVAEKVLAGMRNPVQLEGRSIAVTSSIGVAYGSGSDECEELLGRADAALYEAKKAGRNDYRVAPR